MQVIGYSVDEAAPVRTLSGEHACHWFCSWRCQACSHRQGMGSRQMPNVEACIQVLLMGGCSLVDVLNKHICKT